MRGAAACLLAGLCLTGFAHADPIEVTASPIERFRTQSDETRFGALEYRGGFSFSSRDRRLAGISSFRFRDDGDSFVAVTDTGLWFDGGIERDAAGRPTGLSRTRLLPILDANGQAQKAKGDADAEGLAIDGERLLVSFERDHRVEAFGGRDPLLAAPEPVLQPIPLSELRSNGGIETIAVSPLDGRIVVVAEQSIDSRGDLFAGILGADGGVFTVVRNGPWAVTDGAFLTGGDLLLLERRYEGFGRVGMRIRRIGGGDIAVGARVDGPVLMEADLTYEIDNMEALDVFRNAAGETIVAVLSDDNASFFQRNLYLEFALVEDVPGVSG